MSINLFKVFEEDASSKTQMASVVKATITKFTPNSREMSGIVFSLSHVRIGISEQCTLVWSTLKLTLFTQYPRYTYVEMMLKEWGQQSVFSDPFNVCGDPVRAVSDNLVSNSCDVSVVIWRLTWETKASYKEEINAP